MPKTLIGLSAAQNSALSNYLFQVYEKKKKKTHAHTHTSHFLAVLPGKKVLLAMRGRFLLMRQKTNSWRKKELHTSTQPVTSFSSIMKRFFLSLKKRII